VVYTGHRPENIVELAAQNMGIALLMKRHTDYVANPDVVCIDIAPRVESTVCLVRRRQGKHSATATAFWRFVAAAGAMDSTVESVNAKSELQSPQPPATMNASHKGETTWEPHDC
jgi:hypothetical protein